jgi:DNA-directed RNA polymerase specialized sigma24 family protein
MDDAQRCRCRRCRAEAFLRAFRYFDSYRGDDAKSWVLKIVRRTCYKLARPQSSDAGRIPGLACIGSCAADAAAAPPL